MFTYKKSEDGSYYILTGACQTLPSKVVIPAEYDNLPVKEIGDKAFHNNKSIKAVDLPETIVKIGKYAFCLCTELKQVFFRDGVTLIGENAFAGCENLEEVYMPDTLKTIETFAFADCKNLPEINVTKVDVIKNNAFSNCKSLERVVFGEKIDNIYGAAFCDCTSLREVEFNSAVHIYNSAFKNTAIEDITIPDNSIIGASVFENCKNLQSITIGKNVGISNYGVNSMFVDIAFAVEEEPIFNGSENLKTLILKERNPNAIKAVSDTVEEIVLDGVESIEKGDLKYCGKLKKLVITPSVKKIGAGALGFTHTRLTVDELIGNAGLERYHKVICPYLNDVIFENFKDWKAVIPNSKKAIKIKDKILKDRKKTLEFLMDKYMDYDWINESKFSDKMKKN